MTVASTVGSQTLAIFRPDGNCAALCIETSSPSAKSILYGTAYYLKQSGLCDTNICKIKSHCRPGRCPCYVHRFMTCREIFLKRLWMTEFQYTNLSHGWDQSLRRGESPVGGVEMTLAPCSFSSRWRKTSICRSPRKLQHRFYLENAGPPKVFFGQSANFNCDCKSHDAKYISWCRFMNVRILLFDGACSLMLTHIESQHPRLRYSLWQPLQSRR